MDSIGKEITDFVRTCEAIHALLATGPLAPNEQSLIEFSCNDLLNKMRPELRSHQGQRGLPY
jgi:hypothetical protein